MKQDDWGERIAPRLQDIRYYSELAMMDARQIQTLCRDLPARPIWQTLAREAIDLAKAQLETAIQSLDEAATRYDSMPVILELETTGERNESVSNVSV